MLFSLKYFNKLMNLLLLLLLLPSFFFISVVAVESHPYSAGDTIRMRLMKRAKV